MNSFSFAALTDVGTVRTNNEDSALASSDLLALADGMGGHAAGEVASAVVMHSLTRLLAPGATITPDSVREATYNARQTLRSMSRADHEMEGMGTTLVALGVGPEGIALAHVGDSRIYRVRAGEVTQITTDHTHVQRLVDSGRLDPSEVRTHPYRSVILRSIDDTSDDLPDVALTTDIAAGDRVLLCSDGLSDYVTHESLVASLQLGSPLDAARALLTGALRAGTRDNVTVIVADVHDPELPTTPPTSGDDAATNERVTPTRDSPVLVGASLGQAALTDPARAVLLEAFPDAETLVDTQPRPRFEDDADSDTLPTAQAVALRAATLRAAAAAAASSAAPVVVADEPAPRPTIEVPGQAPDPVPASHAPFLPQEPGAGPGGTIEHTETDADDTEPVAVAAPSEAPPVEAAAVEPPPLATAEPEPGTDAAPLEATAADVLEEHLEAAEQTDLEERFGPKKSPETGAFGTVGENPNDPDNAESEPAEPSQPRRTTFRDVIWLGLVVVTFAVVTLGVWITES